MPTVYGLARFYSDAPPHAQVVYHFSITPPACMTPNPQLIVGCGPPPMAGGFRRKPDFSRGAVVGEAIEVPEEARCHVHQPLHQRCGRRFGCQGHAGWRDRVEASWPNICV